MGKYDDIISLPYVKSKTHKHMSNHDRAAQFAPFAALTGYEQLIKETARHVDKKILLTDDKKEEISNKLNFLLKNKVPCKIKITYFVKDEKKDGGKYVTEEFENIKIDTNKKIIIAKNRRIKIEDILEIESDIFDQ